MRGRDEVALDRGTIEHFLERKGREPDLGETLRAKELQQIMMLESAWQVFRRVVANKHDLSEKPNIHLYRHPCPEDVRKSIDNPETARIKFRKIDLFAYGVFQLETFIFAAKQEDIATNPWIVAQPTGYEGDEETAAWATVGIEYIQDKILMETKDMEHEPEGDLEFFIFVLRYYFQARFADSFSDRTWPESGREQYISHCEPFWYIQLWDWYGFPEPLTPI
ncbi:hypothetical protein ABW19_dt0204086 [Dactylella cylindrospora]|nr:hypothetical protein ABW19_dt0204086 [Dactylella cylindrospora]